MLLFWMWCRKRVRSFYIYIYIYYTCVYFELGWISWKQIVQFTFDPKIKRNKFVFVWQWILFLVPFVWYSEPMWTTMWNVFFFFLMQLGKFSFQFSNNNNITQYLFEEHNSISLSAFYCAYRPNDRFNACLFSEQRGRVTNNL